jgi:hypothetical protein
MSNDDQTDRSPAMAEADTANGEGPPQGAPGQRQRTSDPAPRGDDPDAPGLSSLGEQPGDPVEPNEPG